jgi:C4-dicarboxylate-specific signal transduction histidine kinase
MRERLKLAVDDLNEMQQTLESKVVERTGQLRAAHRKLRHGALWIPHESPPFGANARRGAPPRVEIRDNLSARPST